MSQFSFRSAVTFAAVLLVVFSGQAQASLQETDETSARHQELSDSIENYMNFRYNRQQQLSAWAKERLAKLKQSMAELDDRALKLKESSRKKWTSEVVPKLNKHKKRLKARIEDLKTNSKEAWIRVKWSFGEALETYEQNLKNASERLKDLEKSDKTNDS